MVGCNETKNILFSLECGNNITHTKDAVETMQTWPSIVLATDKYSGVRCIATICKWHFFQIETHAPPVVYTSSFLNSGSTMGII